MRHNTLHRLVCGLSVVLATGLTTLACDKKDAPEATATATKDVAPAGAIDRLVAPAGTLAFGGAESPDALLKSLSGLAGPLGAGLTPELATHGLEQALGLGAASVDATKPARFLVTDAKATEPLVIAFAMKNRDAFASALPADKKTNDAGNAYSYGRANKTVYVNLLDEFAVVTHAPELFGKHKDFVKQLLGSKADGAFSAVVSVKNASEMFGKELDALLAELEKGGGQMKGTGFAPGAPAQSLEMMRAAATFVREIDTVAFTASVPGGDLLVTIDTRAKAESALAKHVAATKAGQLGLLPKLPKETTFAAIFSVDPTSDNALMKQLSRWGMKLGVGAAGSAEMERATDAFYRATTGEMAFFAYRPDGKGDLAMVSLSGVKDADAVRSAWAEMMKAYSSETVKKGFAQAGFDITFTENAYKIGDVAVNVTESKLTEEAKKRPELAQVSAMLDMFTTSHSAVTSEHVVVAMGKAGKSTLEAWLGGKVPGGLDTAPGLVKARARAADNAVGIMYGSPVELIQSILGQAAAAPMPGAPGASAQGGVALSVGQKDGALRIVLDLPAAQLQGMVAAVGALAGGRR